MMRFFATAVWCMGMMTPVMAEEVSGLLEPVRSVELRPEADGAIAAVLVVEGDQVTKGTALVRLDDAVQRARVAVAASTPADARIARATVSVESARSLLNRMERAAQRGGAPKWEVSEARFRLNEATADLRLAEGLKVSDKSREGLEEAILTQFEIDAPFSGVITEISATAGETAARAEPLLTLEDFSQLEATIFAPVAERGKLIAGARYAARLGPPLDQNTEAVLRFVEPRIDPASGTVKAIFVISNENLAAPAGVDLFVDLDRMIE